MEIRCLSFSLFFYASSSRNNFLAELWSIGNVLRNRDQKFHSCRCVFLTICTCSTNCLYIKQNAVSQQCWVITQLIFIISNYHPLKNLTWQNDSNTRLMTLLCHLQVKISSFFNKKPSSFSGHVLTLSLLSAGVYRISWVCNLFKKWNYLFLMRNQT